MKKIILLLTLLVSLYSKEAFAQPANDECATAQNIGTLPAPAACVGTAPQLGATMTIPGTLVGATPASPYVYQPGCAGGAMAVPANDVWYSFTASSYQAVITINSTFATPNIAMYSGTCGALGGGVGGCAVGSGGTVTLTVEQMVIGTTYYIQVSGATGETGTFNMIIRNNKDCSDCINATTYTATPLPVNGMYNPGQVVSFCYHISQYTQINTNWLHGVQLTFGSGWNLASLTTTPPATCQTTPAGGTWAYYPAGCTSSATGTTFGPGFYFDTPDAGTNPGDNFGDNCTGVLGAGTWNFCFTIAVANGCAPGSNLSVTVNTTGDGESGSWSSLGCLDDPASVLPAVGACCIPTMASTPTTCVGNDGTATATPVGVSGPYNYEWTNSVGTVVSSTSGVAGANTATGLLPGTYTVTILNTALSCEVTNTVTVTAGGGVIATPTAGSNSPVCIGSTLNLTATTVAGATYAWTGPNAFASALQNPSIASVTALAAGTYTVVATSGGCTASSTVVVVINPPPTVTVPANMTVCNGANIGASAYSSTPAGGTFTWTNSNTAIGLAASGVGNTPAFTATNLGAAPITATITVTPTVAGCLGTPNTYTITVNPTPVAPTALGTSICTNNSTTLTATAPGGTYEWFNAPGGTLLFTGASFTTPVLTANTTYYVQTTILGCTSPLTPVTVTIAPGLIVNAGLDDTICFGGNTTLNATPTGAGYTYSWAPAAGLSNTAISNPVANPATTTTYTVTITDPGGCVGTDDVTIYSDPEITLAIAGIDVTCNGACNGQTIVIPAGGTPAYSYAWSSGCAAASCSPLCIGTYTVTVTDSWGCTSSGTATVIEPTLLTASITASTPTTCNGVCDGTATAAGNGGTIGGGYAFSWNTVPVQATATATGLCAGTYTCTITDANGCTATTTATITEPSIVVIAPIVSPTICFGGTTNLVASASGGNGGPYAYTWSPATGLDFTNIANPNASPVATTIYTVNATDVNGCAAAPVNVTVTVNPPLSVIVSPAVSICPGASAPISATGSNGSGGPYVYSWSPATGLSNPAISNPSASPATTTTYTVTVTDGCSPAVTATVIVTVLPLPVVTFSGDILSGCSPVCVIFTDASTVAGGTITNWNWSFGDGTTFIGQNPPLHCYSNSGTTDALFTVGLTVTSSLGGCTSTDSYLNYITVFANPVAEFTASPNPATILEPTVNFTDQSTSTFPIVSWNWDFGDGSSGSTATNPSHDFPNIIEGSYNVTLTVVDGNGCIDDVSHTIIINPEFTFFIPNAFTPNGDGVNDFFQGQGVGIKKYEIMIFDRWGNMIWYTDDINKLWDGKANHGKDMAQQDVYVWKVKLTDVFDKKHNYTGTVTIVK